MSTSVDIAEYAAQADLWCGQPQRALDRLVPALTKVVGSDESARAGTAFVYAARAAADLAETIPAAERPARRQALLQRLLSLHEQAQADPFAPGAVSAERSANSAQWAAELGRLSSGQKVETWVSAATEWDRLETPARCGVLPLAGRPGRADSTGQANTARKLLKRAAAQAREHLPLAPRDRGDGGVRCPIVSAEPEFRYSDLLPIGPDETPYRLVTTEGVSTFEAVSTGRAGPSSRSRPRRSSG